MPGKQYIFVITLFQSILSMWNIPGSEMDLVLDNSLHYFWFALDLSMVLLVCFLLAKLSETNLLVLKKEKQPQSMFLKLYNLPSFDALKHSFQLDPCEAKIALHLLSAHKCTGLGFAHLYLVHVLEHIKWQSVCLSNTHEKWNPRT